MNVTDSTLKWWKVCLTDKSKLDKWLVGLFNNERDAFNRFVEFANKYCKDDKNAYEDFTFIAEDEMKHSELVETVLKTRGIELEIRSSANGRYWSAVSPCAVDKQTAAAVGAYAEGLSLARMRVIIEYPDTPEDLREMFKKIEPDEARHTKVLTRIATRVGMDKVIACHGAGLEALGLKIQEQSKT